MKRTVTILEAIDDQRLFRPWFKTLGTWSNWFVFLHALFRLPMTSQQLDVYRQCTGRADAPALAAKEAWLICGRRAGKSFMLALCAVYLAVFRSYREHLTFGERATIMVIAADRKQARVILRYVAGLLRGIPMLKHMIERETADAFDLDNDVSIEIQTASWRSTRGYTLAAALLDELAFWRSDDSANPDTEIIAAIRPAMATIPNAMLLCASSPYAQRGALFDAFKRYYGKNDPSVLVWRAPTRVMNPSVPQSVIDEAMERDPASASAEYMALFRTDVESFVDRAAVEACVALDVREHPPVGSLRYSAFVDPSGGSADSFTLAIGHRQDGVAVLDAVREIKPPFSPESAVEEFAGLLKSYGCSTVTGDRYAGEWPREQFRKCGIKYEPAAKPKSDLYRDLLPAINSRRVDLLDHPRLVQQLVGLERRTARGGRDSIDHAPGAHDDVANAVAGVVASLATSRRGYDTTMSWVGTPDEVRSLWHHPMLLRRGDW